MKSLHVKVTFTEPILGTGSSNPEIHSEFIASKAPDAISRAEEVAAIGAEAVEEKTTTVFARNDAGQPIIWNYQIKGFFKEACAALQRMKGEKCAAESSKIKAFKKVIDTLIEPGADPDCVDRKIPLTLIDGDDLKTLQRPLRGQTAQGERIALASSEQAKAGTTAEFYVRTPDAYAGAVKEWLRYGKRHGMLQWRNAGYGRFTWELLEEIEIE